MLAEPIEILGWARWLCLIGCMVGAAWLDHKYRRIPNEYWIAWAKPAIFIWSLEMLVNEADWMIWATAAAAVALASTAVIGRPSIKDITSGNPVDIVVSIWYIFGISGVIGGAMIYGRRSKQATSPDAHFHRRVWVPRTLSTRAGMLTARITLTCRWSITTNRATTGICTGLLRNAIADRTGGAACARHVCPDSIAALAACNV